MTQTVPAAAFGSKRKVDALGGGAAAGTAVDDDIVILDGPAEWNGAQVPARKRPRVEDQTTTLATNPQLPPPPPPRQAPPPTSKGKQWGNLTGFLALQAALRAKRAMRGYSSTPSTKEWTEWGLGYFDFELPDKDRLVAEHKSVVSRPLQPASPPKPSSVPSPAKLYQDSLHNQIASALALAETLHGLYSGSASNSQPAASIPQTIAPSALALARPAAPPAQAQAPAQSYPPVPPAAQAPAPSAMPLQQLSRAASIPPNIAGPSSAPRNMAPPPVPTPLPANQAGSRPATAAPPTPYVAPSTPASAPHPARPPTTTADEGEFEETGGDLSAPSHPNAAMQQRTSMRTPAMQQGRVDVSREFVDVRVIEYVPLLLPFETSEGVVARVRTSSG
ncbi:hypothetical protein FB107DRAFT_279228 [Schizophyllum commune]